MADPLPSASGACVPRRTVSRSARPRSSRREGVERGSGLLRQDDAFATGQDDEANVPRHVETVGGQRAFEAALRMPGEDWLVKISRRDPQSFEHLPCHGDGRHPVRSVAALGKVRDGDHSKDGQHDGHPRRRKSQRRGLHGAALYSERSVTGHTETRSVSTDYDPRVSMGGRMKDPRAALGLLDLSPRETLAHLN
jgi:hypothetical protein